ncbi:TetR/AcrR family transcriptional regulator [Lactococcus piscium]|uniref:TetR/AcrR family transcriptional regulator n=1 Tax=Pseudolactococcus carnosus TaxID=2749961 RepID=UPI001FB9BBDC|nr:TetR/AcrR family transcriptional regulator [Lactococcus carnosus]
MKKKIDNEKIIHATIALATKQGLLNVSLNGIAANLGIKTPSLYNHISGIEDLYGQLGIYSLDLLEKEVVQSVLGFSKHDALIRIANTYVTFAIQNPVLYHAIENPYLKNSQDISKAKEAIVLIIQSVLKVYNFTIEKEIKIIRVLRSYLHGFASLYIADLFNIKTVDVDESFDLGLNALLSGLGLD